MMKKRIGMSLLIVLILGLILSVGSIVSAEKVEYYNGIIQFYRDFSALNAYDMSWKEDPAVFETSGDLTITPNSIRALGVGKQGVSSTGKGSVSYLVEVPEGNIIKSLVYTAHGRAYHSASNAECSAGSCACAYKVSVSLDGGETYQQISDWIMGTASAPGVTFEYDLSDLVAGRRSVIVQLYMSGKSWDWVHMTDLALNGTYEEGEEYETVRSTAGEFVYENGNFRLFRDFTKLDAYDMSFERDGSVYDFSGGLTITPNTIHALGTGTQNVSSTGEGYISYLLKAPQGNLLETGRYLAHGRAYHSVSNVECNAGTCSCGYDISISTDGGQSFSAISSEDIVTSGTTKSFEYDLTDLIAGHREAIIRIYMSGKNWDWVHITDLTIEGTYRADDRIFEHEDEYDFRMIADYSQLSVYDRSWQNVAYDYDFMERGPGNAALGVGEKDVGSDGTGYVTYRFDAAEGKLHSETYLYIKGRVFHYTGSGDCEEGTCDCAFRVLVSKDGENFEQAAEEKPGLSGSFNVGFWYNLTAQARDAKEVYIKIEITTKNWDWISMSSLSIYGNYRDANIGVTGNVSVSPSREDGRLSAGDNLTLTAEISNSAEKPFIGRVELIYPKYYLSSEISQKEISLAAGKNQSYSFDLTALEGGYGNLFICIYDDQDVLLDSLEIVIYVGGKGVYLGDPHSQSFESDGRNSFLDNFTQLVEKGFSFVITADHNAVDPWNDEAQQRAVEQLKQSYDGEFVAMKGSEVTTAGNAHVLCYNFATNYDVLIDTQTVIDNVINQGGLAFLAHPFLDNYYFRGIGDDPTKTDTLKNFTGIELYNGETSWIKGYDAELNAKNLEFWDRMNLTGTKKYFGTSGSDAHDSIIMGTVGNAFLSDELSQEELLEAFATGRFYITTGPSLRFNINGATFGESLGVTGRTQAKLSVNVYDPDYAISKVILYKFVIGADNEAAYQSAMRNALTLYERQGDTIHSFDYCADITVNVGEFYRVAVYTERGSLNWVDEKAYGLAYGNPVWIEKKITKLEVSTLPTRMIYEQKDVADYSGMVVTATYYDNTTKVVKGWYASGFDSSEIGICPVKILYNGFTDTFDVTITEIQGEVKLDNGEISFERDFSSMEPYDMDWKQDPAVEQTGGNLTASPTSGRGLGVGKKDVSSAGAGYVAYRVEVPAGNVIKTLQLTAHGRAYHSTSDSECQTGQCSCAFEISISRNGGITYLPASNYDINTGSSSFGQEFFFDLTEFIKDCRVVIIKVYLSGKSWDWVSLTDIQIRGTYEEGTSIEIPLPGSVLVENGEIIYDKDFTSLPQYDMSWVEDAAVYEQEGLLTISPSTRSLGVGKKNVSSAGAGSVSYLIDLPDGNIFKTLTFTAHGRAYHSATSSDCAEGKCSCAFKVYISVDGGKIYKEVGKHEITFSGSSFGQTFTYDFADYIKDKKTAVIKVYMSGRSWDWVGFTDFSIRGTYQEGIYIPDVILEYETYEDYSAIRKGDDSIWQKNAYAYENLMIGSGEKPWLSVQPDQSGNWDNVTGSIIYRMSSEVGEFKDMTISGVARVFTYEGSKAKFQILISTDGEDYKLIQDFPATTSGSELTEFSLALTDYLQGTKQVFVQIIMQTGYWDWVCLKELEITGMVKTNYITVEILDGEEQIYFEEEYFAGTALEFAAEKAGYVLQGLYYDSELTKIYDGTSILESVTLYSKWETQTYRIIYHGAADVEEGTYTIESGSQLAEPISKGYDFLGWYLDESLAGEALVYIEVGSTGDLELYAKWEPTIYRITYHGAEGIEEGAYTIEGECVLPRPQKEGYEFLGWYTDEKLSGDPVERIEAGSTGDLNFYAKWIASGSNPGGNDISGCGSCGNGAMGILSTLLLVLGTVVLRRR